MARLTEREHRSYLEMFLKGAKETNDPKLLRRLKPYARDSLQIARDVGYNRLYQEFDRLYKTHGL